jgi:hypothetical protein
VLRRSRRFFSLFPVLPFLAYLYPMPAHPDNKYNFGSDELGRPRVYESPAKLEEMVDSYFFWCDQNPLIREEWNGRDPVKCEVRTQRPYTIEGLALHLGVDRKTVLNYGKKEGNEDLFPIISRARQKITDQQVTFGLAGGYNANVLRLVLTNNTEYRDKQEVDHTTGGETLNGGINMDNLDPDELLAFQQLMKKAKGKDEHGPG